MSDGIVDSNVHFLRVEGEGLASEFDLLGTSILAHLSALPGLFAKRDTVGIAPTIQGLGRLYSNRRKMTGYQNLWIGKAFEYAVAELFNNRSEPHYTLICRGIDRALSTRVSSKVNKVSLERSELSCIRVAIESADAEALRDEFGRFRILQDARWSIEHASKRFRGLENKVDVIFCERSAEVAYRFAILASLKTKRKHFVRRDFDDFPIDLGISIEEGKHREVEERWGIHVVYLPLNADSSIIAWKQATGIVEAALLLGERNLFLRFIWRFMEKLRGIPEVKFWVDFLAKQLHADIGHVVQEIRTTLHQTPGERVTPVPTLLGADEDAVLELVVP